MSYTRVGGNSDLYVWGDGEKYYTHIPLVGRSDEDGKNIVHTTLRGLLGTLSRLRIAGYRVPEPVFKRIRREMRREPADLVDQSYTY